MVRTLSTGNENQDTCIDCVGVCKDQVKGNMKQEYLQLCHVADNGVDYKNWYMSEKLDGMRAFWDGGVTRGMPKSQVPWANCVKDASGVSTGLWSRLGNVINAPDWWLDGLPKIMLDGELWMGYEHRQRLMSQVKGDRPGFDGVGYWVYDVIPPTTMAESRVCTCTGYKFKTAHALPLVMSWDWDAKITGVMGWLQRVSTVRDIQHPRVNWHLGTRIDSMRDVDDALERVLASGGEGLVVRNPGAQYVCARSRMLLKIKPVEECSGVVVGVVDGLGKHIGRIGSLSVRVDGDAKVKDGVIVNVSGLTDAEREMDGWVGKRVDVKYRGLTADGVPMEARYMRDRGLD